MLLFGKTILWRTFCGKEKVIMSKICFFLLGNILHSDVIQPQFERMIMEKGGMPTLREGGIRFNFGWHGLDSKIAPDIYDPGPHDLCSGLATHVFADRLQPTDLEWQYMNGVPGTLEVMYFPEFIIPSDPQNIPTQFFLLFDPETRYYDYEDPKSGRIFFPAEVRDNLSISWEGKTGIRLGNSPLRAAFHAYQQRGLAGDLDKLVKVTEEIAETDNDLHLAWLDLESPYVGSWTNANRLWGEYINIILRRNLANVFTYLKPHLDSLKKQAVFLGQPHRLLDKWMRHDAQRRYLELTYSVKTENFRDWQLWLLAVAKGGDMFSAMGSMIDATRRK
jgi:hypothetical protein